MSDELSPAEAEERAYYMHQIALARRRAWARRLIFERIHKWVFWIFVIWAPLALVVYFVMSWQLWSKHAWGLR